MKIAVQMVKEFCDKILVVLKEASFTKEELEIVNKYFKKIVEVTDKMLRR